jgi:hypothetical protein
MKRSTWMMGASLALMAALAVACGQGSPSAAPNPSTAEVNPAGDIPDDQVFVAYKPPSKDFTVSVPEGWAQTSSGGEITFTDKLNSITISSVPAQAAPTVQSAASKEVPQIASSATNYAAGDVTAVQRAAGDAVLITYEADSPKDPVTGKVVRDAVERYEFFRSGTEVILTLSGPVGADNVDPWKIVTESFKWLP